ncbi:unnamed protein product [Onchocerca flexuosa]|uniref:Uncharacterized protein n=1 Tax=Onchocerca flexuosa TaxID=387005 RepID=A0A183I8P8_9BILA|nr:unnamed protein product [Onchocerca flexuosa]
MKSCLMGMAIIRVRNYMIGWIYRNVSVGIDVIAIPVQNIEFSLQPIQYSWLQHELINFYPYFVVFY